MLVNTKYRSQEEEIMDDFNIKGDALRKNLNEIAHLNNILGGNKLTRTGVDAILKKHKSLNKKISVLDAGCGNGDMLRALADYTGKKGWEIDFIGVDANADAIEYAVELSADYQNISYHCINIFSEDFSKLNYDIAICTLTLHHFDDEQALNLMRLIINKAAMGVVINDLQRSRLSYYLFKLISFTFRLSKMSANDGAISILRGFKRKDFERFAEKLTIKKYSIRWKWAFRFQWVIEKA